MAITQTLVTSFKTQALSGIHAFATSVVRAATTADTFKMALYSSSATLDGDTTAYSTTNEITGTGYSAGGKTLANVTVASASGVAYIDFDDVAWTTATFTANGALIYNSTQGNKAVAVLAFGSNKTATAQTFTVALPANSYTTALIRID